MPCRLMQKERSNLCPTFLFSVDLELHCFKLLEIASCRFTAVGVVYIDQNTPLVVFNRILNNPAGYSSSSFSRP
jgi:hypothetical protein